MPMALTGSQLIGGRWEPAGQRFDVTNPATGETLTPAFSEATRQQADAVVQAAVEAFEATLTMDPRWPWTLLDRVAVNILDLGDALLERAEAETALPRP